MEIRVLGPLQVVGADGGVTTVQRAKPATVLALLVIRARTRVGVDQLLEALWGDAPPASAIKTLQTYVAAVRRVLGAERDRLVTSGGAYRLDVAPSATDAGRFERIVQSGQARLTADPGAAHRELVEALALWRGTPYAEFAFRDFARDEIARLEELRLVAHEGRVEALLRLGRTGEAVPDLQDLTRRHPLREGLWAQLLRGLYASGRQAEALGAYARIRDHLVRELGVEPGPQLQRLEQQILHHQLDIPATRVELTDPTPASVTIAPEQRWITAVHLRTDMGLLRTADVVEAMVQRYGGSVVRVDDHAAVVAFGADVAHDDDSDRAVRCAQQLCRRRINGTLPAAGVATGETRVDANGPSAEDMPFAAAAELAARAQPGAVVVGDGVRRATRRARAGGVAVAATGGPPSISGPVRPGPPVRSAPLIGRDIELRMLDTLWELSRRTGRAGLATVTGAPGIGKSRLVAEFVARLAGTDVIVATGSCRAYGDAVYGAVGEVVRTILAINNDEPVREVRWRTEQWLRALLPHDEQHRTTEYMLGLLSLLGDIADPNQSTVTALRRLLELSADRQPTLVVLKNLHWAHPNLLTLLERAISETIDVPLMVVGVARPELFDIRPTWGGGLAQHTAMSIQPLTAADSRVLAAALRAGPSGPGGPFDPAPAGGNPLFVEELAAWDLEGPHDSPVPATLRSVIDARLDALGARARRVVIAAAVVGAHFWPGAVAAVGRIDVEDVHGWLEHLEHRGVIVRQPTSALRSEREYAFRHDLIADVANGRVPPDLRRAKHEAVGRWLESQPDAPPAVLAHHWREAGDLDRAVRYLCAAAEEADTVPRPDRR